MAVTTSRSMIELLYELYRCEFPEGEEGDKECRKWATDYGTGLCGAISSGVNAVREAATSSATDEDDRPDGTSSPHE